MSLPIEILANHLHVDEDGQVRVGRTRVTLHTIISAFRRGQFAEEIAASFPSLTLPDVYAAITYYLQHRAAVEAYLEQCETAGREARKIIDNQPGYAGLRERLLARMTTREA